MALLSIFRGTQAECSARPVSDGTLLFATDTKKIYLDKDSSRIEMSSVDDLGNYVTKEQLTTALNGKADDAWARTLRVEVMSAPADAAEDTSTLTATVWRGGQQLSDEAVAKMGLLAWYVEGSRVATGGTYTCAAGTAVECRVEA